MHTDSQPITLPAGAYDDFQRVESWDQTRADNWARALDLRASGADQVRLRAEILELAALRAGDTVVEVGCGTGPLLALLAAAVGASGRVIGIEPQPVLAQLARERMRATTFADRVDVRTERATASPLSAGIANVCIAQTVLLHLPEAERHATLARMIALVRTGGRVISADQDAETWVIDHPDRALTRRIVTFYADHRFADGWTGRHLRSLFTQAGLKDIESRAFVTMDTSPASYAFKIAIDRANTAAQAGWISAAERARWVGALEAEAAAGRFFSSLNFYVAAGRT